MAKEKRSFYGTGRRKGSVARVTLTPGTGKITVNGRDVQEYMPYDVLVMDLKQPLVVTGNENTFDVNADVKAIFEKMLDQTDKILTELKPSLEKSGLKVHEVLTLASMAESEGVSLEDRKNIVGVFMNRIKNNMALGSDVTTYYASKIELGERDLYMSEINSDNPYNTRSAKNAGKLPVGPICNPSKSAIEATINYTQNDYLYFVADKNMKVYFTKTDAEHNKKIQELKKQGLWFEY